MRGDGDAPPTKAYGEFAITGDVHNFPVIRTYSPTEEGSSMSCFKKVLLLLAIIGGINWGIYGIWGFNAVGWLLGGSMSWLSRTVFIIVGLSSLCLIPGLFMAETKTAE